VGSNNEEKLLLPGERRGSNKKKQPPRLQRYSGARLGGRNGARPPGRVKTAQAKEARSWAKRGVWISGKFGKKMSVIRGERRRTTWGLAVSRSGRSEELEPAGRGRDQLLIFLKKGGGHRGGMILRSEVHLNSGECKRTQREIRGEKTEPICKRSIPCKC